MAEFLAAAQGERLLLQSCAACGAVQLYPRPFCLACDGEELGWREAAGGGVIYAKTRVHLAAEPYEVALVELDEGVQLLGRLAGGAAIGERVRLVWHDFEGRRVWGFR
jgi:uncharacterized OB-fold protein